MERGLGRGARQMELIDRLVGRLAEHRSGLVAFSGGVDSSLVAALAARAWRGRAMAVTAVSPALASGELDGARRVAEAIGIEHELVHTNELAREGYRRNDRFRCYHCKTELYESLTALARDRGLAIVAAGANADDAGDWRPGLAAAAEQGVINPLLEAGVGKATVRAMARRLEIPSAAKVATPCLASRLPYGTRVNRVALATVDRAERSLKLLGYRELRVRHYGERARVELGKEDLVRASRPRARRQIEHAVAGAGYSLVEVSPTAFRSGSLNREADLPTER
jgi:uncharacterized protein